MIDLIDDLEAGELSVEFEGREPWELLEWALERFAPRIALSTAFQIDGVALLDMAYELDSGVRVFSVDTGRLPTETYELIEQLRERYPGMELDLLSPNAGHLQAMVGRHGPNLFYRQVEHRLLCCNIRKVQPLTRHLATLDAWAPACAATSGRRAPTSGKSRSTTTTARSSSQSARRVDRGRGLGLRPGARGSLPPPLRPRLHVDRLRAVHAGARAGRDRPRRPLVVGAERPEGMRDSLRGRDRRARARASCADRRRR